MRYINKFVTLYDASYLNLITIQAKNITIFQRYKMICDFMTFQIHKHDFRTEVLHFT